jgi:hypothetical protein
VGLLDAARPTNLPEFVANDPLPSQTIRSKEMVLVVKRVVMFAGMGCVFLMLLWLVINVAVAFVITKGIVWAFHTPFPQTFVATLLGLFVLGALMQMGRRTS